MAKKQGVELDTYDYVAKWDSSLSKEENYSAIRQDLKGLSPNPPEHNRDEQEHFEAKMMSEEREFLLEQQLKDFEQIKSSTTPDLDRFYHDYTDMVDILIESKEIHSLVVLGTGGVGKTFKAIQHLATKEKSFSIHNGNISALELYHILYENRKGSFVIFDDTQALLQNKQAMSLLLSALYTASGKTRIVEWRTTSKKLRVPPIFEFESKVVFIANEVPKNIQPLLSRCFNIEVSFTHSELLKIMYEIAKLPHSKLKKEERFEVVDWLRDNTDETTKDFNLRLQKKVELVYLHKHSRWKELASTFVTKDETLALVKKICEEQASAKDQVKAFCEQGLGSRAYFYEMKNKLGLTRRHGL